MGEFNSRGLWAQETALHRTGYSCATTRMEWKSIRLRWDAEVLWPLPPSAGKDLGIHGQALRQTIRSVSEAAKRSSQWIWIKRKDPCWAHRTAKWPPPQMWLLCWWGGWEMAYRSGLSTQPCGGGEWLARPACGGGSLGSFRGLHCYQLKESPCGHGKLPEVPLLELGSPDCQGLMRHSWSLHITMKISLALTG